METDVGEMYTFLGWVILQGIVKMPTFYSYHFTTRLGTPLF